MVLLESYEAEGDNFFLHVVTGDESWFITFIHKLSEQTIEWWHSTSPKQKKLHRSVVGKVMPTLFSDQNDLILNIKCPQNQMFIYRWTASHCDFLKNHLELANKVKTDCSLLTFCCSITMHNHMYLPKQSKRSWISIYGGFYILIFNWLISNNYHISGPLKEALGGWWQEIFYKYELRSKSGCTAKQKNSVFEESKHYCNTDVYALTMGVIMLKSNEALLFICICICE